MPTDDEVTNNDKVDLSKRQFKMRCVQQLKKFAAPTTKYSETIYDYLKTFARKPSRTMYGQYTAIIFWIERMFRRYCNQYRFTIEYDKRNCIHVHALYTCENRMKRRWLLEKTELRGFVFSKPVESYDHAWNYLIKDIDEIEEIVYNRTNNKYCLHNYVFNNINTKIPV